MRKGMLTVTGILFFVCLGLTLGDLYFRQWGSFLRDLFTAISLGMIWITWKILFK